MPARNVSHALARDGPLMYAGVFLMGSPFGVLMMMIQSVPQGWLTALLSAVFAGLISAGWAYTFIRERWWILIPLIAAPVVLPDPFSRFLSSSGLRAIGMGLSPQWRMIVLAIMCTVLSVLGFLFIIVHQRKTERSAARSLAELDLAAQVHDTLVPPITLTTPIAEVFGRSVASSTMGGDLIDAVSEANSLDVLVGDVSGHGVGAGVVMAMLKSSIRTRLLHGANLGEVVADANKVLADLTAPNMFATFVALRLRRDRTLEYALAGHLPIFHYRAAEARWTQYDNQNLPLGIDGDERFVAGTTTVAPGDLIAVFTDGLMEVQSSAAGGRELGLDGVGALLAMHPTAALQAIHRTVMDGVAAHGPQLDDQSLVLVRVA